MTRCRRPSVNSTPRSKRRVRRRLACRSRSGEDARRCSSLITRIWRTGRLYQQDVHFPARHGPLLDALGHNENLARFEFDRAIPQLDVERTLEHKKKIARASCLCQFYDMPEIAAAIRMKMLSTVLGRNTGL
jgi:hypothetical protein